MSVASWTWMKLLPLAVIVSMPLPAIAQPLDMSKGGPVTITSRDGIDWQQAEKVVIARGDARAERGNVTVTADRLTARYRDKAQPQGAPTPQARPGFACPLPAQQGVKPAAGRRRRTPVGRGARCRGCWCSPAARI